MKKLLIAVLSLVVLSASAFPITAPAKAPAFQQAFNQAFK